jgi:polysaccharide biosynthesis/export protein
LSLTRGKCAELSRVLSYLIASVLLAGCGGLPAGGPTSKQILRASAPASGASQYQIVDIDPQVADVVARSGGRASSGQFSRLSTSGSRGIGVGDAIAVTIFEASTGGLFGVEKEADTGGAPRLNLPVQTVDRSGTISVPYAGSIPAAGRSPLEVQKTIEKRLAKRAIEPQAIVTVVSNESRLVTVTGDVEKGGRVPLNGGGERLLDAIALSGGARGAAHDSYVKLTRGGRSEDMLLQRLVNSPKENVRLQAGDQIFVYQRQQKFVALGASTTNTEVNFAAERLSLAEAMARAGGLDDSRADPAGVFIFRYEDAKTYGALIGQATSDEHRPVVYRLNLKQPNSLLAAQRFPIRDNDVVYFANSPSTELSKFLALIGSGVGVTNGGVTTVVRVAQ